MGLLLRSGLPCVLRCCTAGLPRIVVCAMLNDSICFCRCCGHGRQAPTATCPLCSETVNHATATFSYQQLAKAGPDVVTIAEDPTRCHSHGPRQCNVDWELDFRACQTFASGLWAATNAVKPKVCVQARSAVPSAL